MSQEPLRIGMAQMLVVGGDPEANLDRAGRFIAEAGSKGCRLVVLPECLDFGWTDPSARHRAEPIPGRYSERLACAARLAGVYVVAGLVERSGERIYNAAVLISPQAELLLVHRKINELEIARDLYSTGDRLAVVATELGVLGVNICADNFPESLAIGEVLARMGAQVLLSPCAWAVDGDHDNEMEPYGHLWREAYGELGTRFSLPVVGVSCVGPLTAGPWKGRKAIGCSLATNQRGEPIAIGRYGETAEDLIVVELEPRSVSGAATSVAAKAACRN